MAIFDGVKDLNTFDNTEVYPVPANNYVTVKLGNINSEEIAYSSFINALGIEYKTVKAINNGANQVTFDLSNLPDGIYYIKLKTIQGIEIVKKVIKIAN